MCRGEGGLDRQFVASSSPIGLEFGAESGITFGPPEEFLADIGSPVLSEEILQFIRSSIKSVWALELLLFIRRHPAQSWTIDGLTTELRSSVPLVTDILSTFKDSGLVKEEPDGRFRYQPATTELEQLAQQLQQAYATRPLAVVKAILSAPNEKIQMFADAFKLKRD